jgi:hypothetical protein
MNTEIFIVTHAKDFPWLVYCLRSIDKFARGFSAVSVVVPDEDVPSLRQLIADIGGTSGIPVFWQHGTQWPGKGHLWHLCQKMHADTWCPTADFICHLDADCVFTAPVTPDTFIQNGKPILQFERFATLIPRCAGVEKWKVAAERALPFPCPFETMRGHPETYIRRTYLLTRQLVEEKTGLAFDDYLQSFDDHTNVCEFVTLGNVAMKIQPEMYCLVDNALKPNPDKSNFPVGQFWSFSPPDQPQDTWWDGTIQRFVPLDKLKQLGLV